MDCLSMVIKNTCVYIQKYDTLSGEERCRKMSITTIFAKAQSAETRRTLHTHTHTHTQVKHY